VPAAAVVLLYHRVHSATGDPWGLAVDPRHFAEHVELLASTFRPLPLGRLVEDARLGHVAASSVAVTFDDGYRDNLVVAKPLLERHGVAASVFVVTGAVGSAREFWWDRLERVRTAAGLPDADYRALHARLLGLAHESRRDALDELLAGLSVSAPHERTTLTVEELGMLASGELIEVGAHTVTHPDLRQLPRSGQLREMRASRRQLEDWLARPVTGFAYPFGGLGPTTAGTARAAGFAYACTSMRAGVSRHTDPFLIPRLHVRDWPADELERRISEALRAG
jgi:peptidoglycan/xylan/chitin deacetylase (PgdA/CDA1 family)